MGLGAETNDHAPLRRVVAESWRRSRGFALDPDAVPGVVDVADDELRAYRDEHPLVAARPIMEAYTRRIVHLGKSGAGQTCKMVNQIAFAGIIASLSEALRFAQSSHLDLDKVYEAISGGASQSWQMDNRWHTMAKDEFDFGFAVDWMRKDLGLALDEARVNGATLPVASLVDQFYADVQRAGGRRKDTSSLVTRLPK